MLTCQAILFDFDGVVVHSDTLYERLWKDWADEYGASYEHIISIHHGIPAVRTISIVAPHLDPVYEAEQFQYRCASDLEGLDAGAGVKEVFASLPANRWAIATSSYKRIVKSQLSHFNLPIPDVLVTIEDVKEGKPAPDPYLQAAQGLGFAPENCVVIEDSPAGIKAARAAGTRVIGMATSQPAEALHEADWVVNGFADLLISYQNDQIIIESRSTDQP